jgi:hypothetical protein
MAQARTLAAAALGAAALIALATSNSPAAAPQPTCGSTVDAAAFASAKELRRLDAKLAGFGLRSPGSAAHKRELAWLDRELRSIPGMRVRSDYYAISRWQPRHGNLARAGGLSVAGSSIPVTGAIPYTVPTSSKGRSAPLVYIPPDQEITRGAAQGKIIVRDLPPVAVPYGFFGVVAHYLTPDFPSAGNYDRPYIRPIDDALTDAGKAGAVGLVSLWEVPGAQLRGYWDPHSGTRFRVSGVFAGNEQAAKLRRLAQQGQTARIVVRATWGKARTRNIIGTLRGQTRARIVVNTHTDGLTWVQENGSAGVLALARYLGGLPASCRHRDLQFALTSAHLGFRNDGTFRYGRQLDRDFDKGTVDFVTVLEHLGTREILPSGPSNRLAFTGKGEPFVWSVGEESPAMVHAAVAATKRRKLDRTAVLKGVEAPVGDRVPEFCSQGGLGSNFQPRLVPTTSMITGPWSLWAPSFGARAIDFGRMRKQVLAMGDVIRSLDRVPRKTIAGSYPKERRERAKGAKTCTPYRPPAVAPR